MNQETAINNQPILILTSCASVEEAMNIANELVKEKLVACAQVQSEMTSIYQWNGKTETSNEVPLHLKTTNEHWEDVKRVITSLHSYEVPEIIAIPIVEIAPKYQQWLLASVKKEVLV